MKTKCPTVRSRQSVLEARRQFKMASSAHAYVRGSTAQFYRWLAEGGSRLIPKGPPIWICGDCHIGNLGPLADSNGVIHVQIRDLDQTVIGNPNHDLVRLALSLASAARGSDLPGVTTAHMMENLMSGYIDALNGRSRTRAKPESVRLVVRRAHHRTWKHLARERLTEVKPKIPKGERFWPLSREESGAIGRLFDADDLKAHMTSLKGSAATVELLDAAYWMKGCSSLGKLRFAALLKVHHGDTPDAEFCLIDIKEASQAAAPREKHAKMPVDNALRVVEGARHLSPALGGRMLPARLLNRPVFLRELMPQDLKLEIDRLTRTEAVGAARYLAGVVGKAHRRQMDAATARDFVRTLRAKRSKQLQAPSWLWSSVVDLAATHEAAYLEHCRMYALG